MADKGLPVLLESMLAGAITEKNQSENSMKSGCFDFIEFSKWGTILGDEKLAAATIDRVVHHGRLVEFNGPSRRMDTSLMLGRVEE